MCSFRDTNLVTFYFYELTLFFFTHYVKADYKVATFLAFIVADAYGVPRNLLAPERLKYKSFVQ